MTKTNRCKTAFHQATLPPVFHTFCKRFARLTLDFSKKLDNLKASVSLYVAPHNFVWRLRQKGNSGKLRPTAAMQAGLTFYRATLRQL
ncbi:MAG: hypothetical protein IID46_11355 [Planctomycetes bacterium]|nr:hypothetical protein [Planctomycetota bacterium]